MLECVVNISEGRDLALVQQLGVAAGPCLLDEREARAKRDAS